MSDAIVSAGKFLKEQLREIEPKVKETVYPEYWGYEGKYHTVVPGLQYGTTEIYRTRIDYVGKASTYDGRSTDIPLVNFGIDSDKNKTIMCIVGAEWHWEKLQQEQKAKSSGTFDTGFSVVESYMKALNKAIAEWGHQTTLFGDKNYNVAGLFNSPDVETVVITDDLYAMTPSELFLFLLDIITGFKKTTKLTYNPVDMLTCIDLFSKLTKPIETANSTFSSDTPYGSLTSALYGSRLRSINEINELDYQSLVDNGRILAGANQDMFMLYSSTSDVLDKKVATPFRTPVGLMDDQLTYRTTAMFKQSEVRFKTPYKVKYYLYPKKS